MVTPVAVPWFSEDFRRKGAAAAAATAAEKNAAQRLGHAPHLLFVGLAFLEGREVTIDTDSRRMTIASSGGGGRGAGGGGGAGASGGREGHKGWEWARAPSSKAENLN